MTQTQAKYVAKGVFAVVLLAVCLTFFGCGQELSPAQISAIQHEGSW